MIKKVVTIILALAIILGFSAIASATSENSPQVYVNNVEVVSTPSAMTVEGSVFLPFRAILNAMGVTDDQITYYPSISSLEIKTPDKYIFMAIGSTGVILDKQMVTITSAPFSYEGRTFVPVRAIADLLGAKIEWNATDKIVNITN